MERPSNAGIKPEQVLILDPKSELRFCGPFNDVVTSHLRLTNPSDRRVCFKVKTTAPRKYCVRPNNGIIEPHATATIAVMLQPTDKIENDKNKHKFMVQSMFAPDGDVNQETLWKEASPELIMDSKLKCVFDEPNSDAIKPVVTPSNTGLTGTPLSTESWSKATGDQSSHSSVSKSKVSGSPGITDELKKMNDENKRLKDELRSLRNENMQLKEDGLKQRIRGGISPSLDSGFHQDYPSKGDDRLGLAISPQLIGILFLMFLFGVMIGKVVF